MGEGLGLSNRSVVRVWQVSALIVVSAFLAIFPAPNASATTVVWTSEADFSAGTLVGVGAAPPGDLVLLPPRWVKFSGNPVVTPVPGTWENSLAGLRVLREGGVFRMWYSGCLNPGGVCDIGYANSSDGISWTKYAGNPVLLHDPGGWDGSIAHPFVLHDGGVYRMWYTGSVTGFDHRIGYAESSDGLAWTKSGVVLGPTPGAWDAGSVTLSVVVKEGSNFTMWYSGHDGSLNFHVGRATSSDGMTWTKDAANPVMSPSLPWEILRVHAAHVLGGPGAYEMFYVGHDGLRQSFGHATSPEGLNWTRDSDPILTPGPDAWDAATLGSHSVVAESGTTRAMWYGGSDGARGQIGLATQPVPRAGTFESTAFDSGVAGTSWDTIDMDATIPAGTEVHLSARAGDTSTPDASWTPWTPDFSALPSAVGLPDSRYLQVRAHLTSDSLVSPIVHEIRVTFTLAPNSSPAIASFTATTVPEGTPVVFAVEASDLDGDPLTYSFDFEDDGIFDQVGSSDTASFTWGDNHVGTARVLVSDGTNAVEETVPVTVSNVAPTAVITVAPATEGGALTVQFTLSDPGSDDLTATVDWADGGSDARFYLAGPFPDLPESTDVNPRSIADSLSRVYGDDGTLSGTLSLADDDGGAVSYALFLVVGNGDPGSLAVAVSCTPLLVPPAPAGAHACEEGEDVYFSATVTDPGSDDLTFQWDFGDGATETRTYFNDGLGPDLDPSFGGVFPFTAMDAGAHVWGDDGAYPIALTVLDDDGGVLSAQMRTIIANVAPVVDLHFDAAAYEENGMIASALATFFDPGSDDVTLSWAWALGPSATRTFFNDGSGPDPLLSPWGTFPLTGTDSMDHRYGDNGVFRLTVTATDDDGGSTSTFADVVVENVDPTIEDLQIYAAVDITLRVAGEKFHDVCLDVIDLGVVTSTACVVRMPGSPDEQAATLVGGSIRVLGDTSFVLRYTPDDDPVNGQRNGANPAWVDLTFRDGSTARLHHTFNVRHPATWSWTLDDLRPILVGRPVTFEVTATDPGSDDLTLDLDFGDGGAFTTTVFRDGVGPDPYPSPDIDPITATLTATHAYAMAGTYLLEVRVGDDDGGLTSSTVSITL